MPGASAFSRHWVYGPDGALLPKLVDVTVYVSPAAVDGGAGHHSELAHNQLD